VRPQAHYFEGGLKINEKCEASISGLYAAGECTGGMFGANRVAAATTEMLVQGAIAGEQAGEYARKASTPDIDTQQVKRARERVLAPFQIKGGTKPSTVLARIQQIADEKVGVIRDEATLKSALEEVEAIKRLSTKMSVDDQTRNYNLEWIEALEATNLALLLEATVKAALMRTESRGVHYREDHPYVDNENWLNEIVVKMRSDGSVQLRKEPVTVTTVKLPKGKTPFDKYIIEAAKAEEE
jgi:succinate dehydrogenase/fumarate reductase flavoprotein subunit